VAAWLNLKNPKAGLQIEEPVHGSVPSTIKLREFVDLLRIALISSWAGELYQALALSMLSNEIMTNRFTPYAAVQAQSFHTPPATLRPD
jgi:hypothetical protein